MIEKQALEARLLAWAEEYGGGKYANVGWSGRNLLATLIEHEGFVPDARGFIPIPIRSPADEVESVVIGMETGGWLRQAKVLRCDYFQPTLDIESRLRSMRAIGFSMSRTAYYDLLTQAKAYVAGALSKAVAA